MLIIWILQGCQNFYEKVRTFPEQIRTVPTLCGGKSVQLVQKIRTIRTFYWKKSVNQ